jgi:hypothetical protein
VSQRGHTHHAVTGDQRGQLLLVEILGAGRALGQDQVADLGAGVPDADLDVVCQLLLAGGHCRRTAQLDGLVTYELPSVAS